MAKPFLLAISLIALLPAFGSVSAQRRSETPTASEASEPFNVGFVLYTKGRAPGTLNARWNYANAYSGQGLATGGPAAAGFAGRYRCSLLSQGRAILR